MAVVTASALEGVRVIDFGQYMAGPMAAMLLGDQGADVIRIDPPGGPRWDTPANATWNRNKRSIVLDLKQEADQETARKLIGTADVLIENFRPGVMDRLGLGAAAMTALNSRLIYCSLPGFAADDPRATVRAWEGVLGAATGAYQPSSAAAEGNKDRPVYTVIPYASACGAFLCAVTVAMALNARERSGLGQRVEIPLFDATFSVVGARGLLVNGRVLKEHHYFPWNRPFLCKDGRWLMHDANNKNAQAFMNSVDMVEWREAGLSHEELLQKFSAVMLTRTAQEWQDIVAEAGSEGVICHTGPEWLRHPQARETQIIADYDDPVLGRFRGPGINARLARTPGAVRRPRPKLDQHRGEILAELAAFKPKAAPQAAGEALRSALEGVKVVDLCIVLAGPTCGRTMAEFGADVIKIDSPYVDTVLRHNDINRAKRSVLIDLKNPEGLALFWKIVDRADVVLQNFRSGVAEKLGVGYEQVRARRPDIIYASMNTYGHLGAFCGRPGHEGLAQAVSGMQVRLGSEKPAAAPFAANDYGTGLMACYGVALALLHRSRTGEGQFVDTALTYTATMLQSALLQDYPGKQWNEPHGQEALGSGPLDRLYQALDGWLFLAARPEELSHCAELADLANRSATELEQALEVRLRQQPVAFWVAALTKAGIGAHRNVPSMVQLMTDPLTVARGLAVTREHEGLGPVTTTAPAVKLSHTPATLGAPASKPGKDIAGVLEQIGMAAELDRLIRSRVIAVDGVKAGC